MLYGIETVKGSHFRRVTLENQGAPRPAGQGRHPDADRVSQSHVARAARRLDPGPPARHAAGRSAARRAVAAGEPARPAGQDAAGAARAAPREPHLLRVSRRDGSARVCPRELQRGGAVPRQRPRHADADRHGRSAAGRHGDRRARRSAPAAGGAARSSVRAGVHGKPDDLRPRPQPRLSRHADGAPHRPSGRGRQLPLQVDRPGRHLERCVPQAGRRAASEPASTTTASNRAGGL